MKLKPVLLGALFSFSMISTAQTEVSMKSVVQGTDNQTIGTVTLKDTKHGLLITPDLKMLSPGMHGFHLHENPSCDNGGKAAGGHFDPQKTQVHLGPYDTEGHLGDMPALFVDKKGEAKTPILAPRLKEKDFKGHAIVIHQGGDNYSDDPKPLGGGGARVACGVIK